VDTKLTQQTCVIAVQYFGGTGYSLYPCYSISMCSQKGEGWVGGEGGLPGTWSKSYELIKENLSAN